MKPAIGAWTERAIFASRARSPNSRGPVVVHPEAALEVDLAGVEAALPEERDRRRRALAPRVRGQGRSGHVPCERKLAQKRRSLAERSANPRGLSPIWRVVTDLARDDTSRWAGRAMSSGAPATLRAMAKRPSRIDLLELDIDLRLADLWREAADIGEWNPRGGRGLHARGLWQGLLRRAHRGQPGQPLRGARLPDPVAQRPSPRAAHQHPGAYNLRRGPEPAFRPSRARALGRGGARGLPALQSRSPAAAPRSSRRAS